MIRRSRRMSTCFGHHTSSAIAMLWRVGATVLPRRAIRGSARPPGVERPRARGNRLKPVQFFANLG